MIKFSISQRLLPKVMISMITCYMCVAVGRNDATPRNLLKAKHKVEETFPYFVDGWPANHPNSPRRTKNHSERQALLLSLTILTSPTPDLVKHRRRTLVVLSLHSTTIHKTQIWIIHNITVLYLWFLSPHQHYRLPSWSADLYKVCNTDGYSSWMPRTLPQYLASSA